MESKMEMEMASKMEGTKMDENQDYVCRLLDKLPMLFVPLVVVAAAVVAVVIGVVGYLGALVLGLFYRFVDRRS